MMCFKFLKSLCLQIDSLLAKFCWGNRGASSIHWKSWSSLDLPKSQGGMGFRNLQNFNQALLAKQCWRMLMNPSALWIQLLKARYFPTDSFFLQARRGSSPSWIWKSLLFGRDLLVPKIAYQVGNGGDVPIWNTNWFPQVTEALVLCLGVQLAILLPDTHFVFESDSFQLVRLLLDHSLIAD
ncbi:uncharacterized mitochondrial protein AtMg00310-like [Argentina anserina]|uniref:uncharacterized mitochondrial protein AtMg00310-like n=1 Tax=Argentina anserina TaxID=57926 RepID=UPI0021768740|nr:uncharacterized mitochondrial protein AtMg00310-like [Potentilla anserina]